MIPAMSITADDLQAMVTHWLSCPPNGYLGSAYGSGVNDLLHTPLGSAAANALLAKLRTDIAVMAQLPEDALNVYTERQGPDQLTLYFEVAGSLIPVDLGTAQTA